MRYAAPTHLSAVKIVADVASSIPNPSIDAVIAVRSPSATPATVAMPERRRPWPSAYDTTSRVVGPGIASRIAEAVTNASHVVTDTQISLVKARSTEAHRKPERNGPSLGSGAEEIQLTSASGRCCRKKARQKTRTLIPADHEIGGGIAHDGAAGPRPGATVL